MSKGRVLVLEDSDPIRELIVLHLTNAGYEVREAEDAVVAGELILQAPPDLIITDISLPYMSGIDFIAALRTEPGLCDIPVVFLTSHADDQFDDRAKQLRAAAYLTKPVSLARLLEVVALCVDVGH
jgi:CheY-like chemotaxis protein